MNSENVSRVVVTGCLLLLTVGATACGSSSGQQTPDGAQPDLQSVDQQTLDQQPAADTQPDVQADTAADVAPSPTDGGADAGDGPAAVDCAPGPTGGAVAAGTAAQQAAGAVVASTATRPELAQAVADGQYTIKKALARGGQLTLAANGTDTAAYSLSDDWDPLTNGIGNPSTFTPTFTVATDGSGTHASVNAAIAAAIQLAGCSRIYIRLVAGVYREQVNLASKTSAPPITLYSTETDATKTKIVFNAAASTVGNMSASATLTVKAATGFQMKNLTIANDYVEDSAPGNDQSAVAFLNQADRSQFENVRFLGNIGTVYLKAVNAMTAARSYFRDSYIEGDHNVILGRATAVFDHTEVKVLASRQTTGGVIAYPSTLIYNRYGFLFDSCQFTAETGATGISLGHQWQESGGADVVGKMVVRNSNLGGHIAAEPWSTLATRMTTPKNPAGTTPVLVYTSDDYFPAGAGPTPAEPYLAEYGNTGAGAHH